MRGSKVCIVVIIGEEEALVGDTYIRGRAVHLDGTVAPAVPLDPSGDCPLADAPPGRIVLGATMVVQQS